MPFVSVGSLGVHDQLTGPSGAPVLIAIHSLGPSSHLFDRLAEGLLLHSSVYAGAPAANAAIRVAKAGLSD